MRRREPSPVFSVIIGWLIGTAIAMGICIKLTHADPAVAQHRWHLYAGVLDANTGKVIKQLQVRDESRKPLIYATPEACGEQLLELGPTPVHEGFILVFRCVRDDALPDVL